MRRVRDYRRDCSYMQSDRFERISSRRNRHSADTLYKSNPLAHLIVCTVHKALHFKPHPDSSRTIKAKLSSRLIKQARRFKAEAKTDIDIPIE